MPLKTWMSLGVFDVSMWIIVEFFFKFGGLLPLDTMYPKITFKCMRNMHFLGFKLISNSLHLSKHSHSFGKWVSKLLNMLSHPRLVSWTFQDSPWKLYSPPIDKLVEHSWAQMAWPPKESPPINDECSLVLVFKGDHDVVVITKSIQKWIDLMTCHFIQHLFSKG
jgi:hypothetical protein